LSNQRQIVFFGFMFVCSLCSTKTSAAVSASNASGEFAARGIPRPGRKRSAQAFFSAS